MLTTASHSWTVETLIRQVERGGLARLPGIAELEPWDEVAMSRLVESAVVGLPLGQIVAVGGNRGPAGIVDGRRRLTALALFAGVVPPWPHRGTPGFALTGVEIDRGLEGLTLADLSRDAERRNAFDNHSAEVVRLLPGHGIDLGLLRARSQG